MKFTDPKNPYFGRGKLSPQEYVNKEIEEMRKEMKKKKWESEGAPYGIEKTVTYSITIAGGGPSAWYEIDTEDHEIIGGRWRYAWWGNPEEVDLSQEEAEDIAKYFDLYIE